MADRFRGCVYNAVYSGLVALVDVSVFSSENETGVDLKGGPLV